MHTIAVAGHVCLDVTPRLSEQTRWEPGQLVEVGPLAMSLGGCVANTGVTLADLGAEVTPFATVGDDELGELLLARLSAEGFAAPRLTVSASRSTSYSLVLEQPGIDRTFWHHTGANEEFDGADVEVTGHSLLHLGYPTLLPGLLAQDGRPLVDLLARARAEGVTTSLDLAVADPTSASGAVDWDALLTAAFAQCDIASPSVDDLVSALRIDEPYSPGLVDRLADRMLADGVAVVAISAGRHGLRLRTGSVERLRAAGGVLAPLAEVWADQALTVHPLWVEHPVTTNGAGDASTAGLLFALSRGADPGQAAALAAACSAAIISGNRATPAAVLALEPSTAGLFED